MGETEDGKTINALFDIPLAKSSSISRSLSFADMDRYKAVTEYRFDWRIDRVPS